MSNYEKGGMTEAPKQVIHPEDANRAFKTDKDGIVYPKEISRPAAEYQKGEGSMGFERNQAVKRDTWQNPVEGENEGWCSQYHLEAKGGGSVKEGKTGSYAI